MTLDKIKKQLDADLAQACGATDGPWEMSRDLSTFEVSKDDLTICTVGPQYWLNNEIEEPDSVMFNRRYSDSEFIANSRIILPRNTRALIKAIELLEHVQRKHAPCVLFEETMEQIYKDLGVE